MKDVDLKNQIDGRNAAHDSIRSISGGVLTSLLLLLILSSSTLIEAQTPSMTPGEIYNQDLDPVLKSVEGLTMLTLNSDSVSAGLGEMEIPGAVGAPFTTPR